MTDDLHKRDAVTRWGPYAVDGGCDAYGAMEEDEHGDYVDYEDHCAIIAALLARLEAVKKERDELDGANILNRNALKRCQASAEKAEAALAVAGQNAANIARSFSCCHVPQEIAAEILAQIEERGE